MQAGSLCKSGAYDLEVAAGGVRGAHAAVVVARAVGLALAQVIRIELVVRDAVLVEAHEHVLHHRALAVAQAVRGERLEPVAGNVGAVGDGPLEHRCVGEG